MALKSRTAAAVIQASLAMLLVYLLCDALVEYVVLRLTGVSVVRVFERVSNTAFGARFHAVNLVLFASEMLLVVIFYALIRPRFASRTTSVATTATFFLALIALFLGQMVNPDIYPWPAAAAFLASTAVAFPISVTVGALVYDAVEC
jgi:hypothetical protein